MADSNASDHFGVEIEVTEKNDWEYHSRIYDTVDAVLGDLHNCFSHRRSWQQMTKFKAAQMDALPPVIWLQTSWQYEAACKFDKMDADIHSKLPPMCFCYRRRDEYVFIRAIPQKVMMVEHMLTDDGLIALQFKNALTGDVEVHQKFHMTERLKAAKEVAEKVLQDRGVMSNNVKIHLIPKMSLTKQLRNIFNVNGKSLKRVKRRLIKKTPSNDATSDSFKTCVCFGCTALKNMLFPNLEDHFQSALDSFFADSDEETDNV